MSRFEIYLEILAYPKGKEIRKVSESYDNWTQADTVYEGYKKAAAVPGSIIQHVEFIEHREERVHKAFTKRQAVTFDHVEEARHVIALAS